MAMPLTTSEAVLTALAGLRAYDARQYEEVRRLGSSAPDLTFGAAVSLASHLAKALREAGGNPDAVLDLVHCRALEKAIA